MENERPTLDKIIAVWKADCGETKQSDRGTTYIVVPIADRYGNFLNLIQTILDHGYTKDELSSVSLRTKVVMACWPEIIKKMSHKDLKLSRVISANQWDEAINKFSDLKISKYVEPLKPEPKVYLTSPSKDNVSSKENLLNEIINPKNRLVSSQKIDRSADTNWELLEELGINLDGSSNE